MGNSDDYYDKMIDDALREEEDFGKEGEGSKQREVCVNESEEKQFVDSDGEDPVERMEYENDFALADFNEDNEGVRHDEYYDSGEDSDEEEARRVRERNFTPRHDGVLFKGQKFFNGIAFKEAVLWHALKNQRNIRQMRYDKRKLSFACLGMGKKGNRCGWKVYSSVRKGHTKWRIRSLGNGHSCEKSGQCRLLKDKKGKAAEKKGKGDGKKTGKESEKQRKPKETENQAEGTTKKKGKETEKQQKGTTKKKVEETEKQQKATQKQGKGRGRGKGKGSGVKGK